MEFDTPGADHSSLIIPHSHDEASNLEESEHGWAKHDAWPRDPERDVEPKMIEALTFMRELESPPVLIANHPSRSATDLGVYGLDAPEVAIRVRDPDAGNAHGDNPAVVRVDVIAGEVRGILADPTVDTNSTTRVVRRFTESDWVREGEHLTMSYVIEHVRANQYVRIRGTESDELEPENDPRGEDPWTDLWFYSNPIFVSVR